jgi:hypothetical protein
MYSKRDCCIWGASSTSPQQFMLSRQPSVILDNGTADLRLQILAERGLADEALKALVRTLGVSVRERGDRVIAVEADQQQRDARLNFVPLCSGATALRAIERVDNVIRLLDLLRIICPGIERLKSLLVSQRVGSIWSAFAAIEYCG